LERQSVFAVDGAFDERVAADAFVSVIAVDTSLEVVAVALIASPFEAIESAAAASMNYSTLSSYFAKRADIDLRDSNSMAALFDCSSLVELVVAHYLVMTYWTSTMSDSENWAVLEGSFVDASQTSAVDACELRFVFESVVESFLVQVVEIDVEASHLKADADERLGSVTPNATDGRQQPFYRLYSDKFDRDNLIELMIDAAEMRQRQPPSEQPTVLEDYLSS
jgi:hypothetical protein